MEIWFYTNIVITVMCMLVGGFWLSVNNFKSRFKDFEMLFVAVSIVLICSALSGWAGWLLVEFH